MIWIGAIFTDEFDRIALVRLVGGAKALDSDSGTLTGVNQNDQEAQNHATSTHSASIPI
jgi:hypothetical protein